MEEPGALALLRRDLKSLADKNEGLQKEIFTLREELEAARRAKPSLGLPLAGSPEEAPRKRTRGAHRVKSVEIVDLTRRSWAPPVTESLEPQVLDEVLGALFPLEGPPFSSDGQKTAAPWIKDLEVTRDEMAGVIRRLRLRGNKAPGPDGIPGRVRALDHLSERLRQLFTSCLRQGYFPPAWVRARLVLILKGGGPGNSPRYPRPGPGLGPPVRASEAALYELPQARAGKLLERLLVDRLVRHLSQNGMDLNQNQYGFREGKSTIDAIFRVHHGGGQGGRCGVT
ncbi:uncharacterized protein LOC115242209 [Formica exsecta]|uniref:uncharacterized protein LOC115242209 n=1 Tax=Formica exsecta TaxID=72781 RepID=UPI0011413A07|nr:uncharacterized protein LOC115242209 [Formica exsecta]